MVARLFHNSKIFERQTLIQSPKMSRTLHICSALAASVLPLAQAATFSLYGAAPAGWTSTGSSAGASMQTFTIALTMQNIDQLDSKLVDVSTPGNAAYGAHWSDDTVSSYFAPSSDTVSSVTSWLEENGVSNYQVDGAFIDFGATVETANSLLNASYKFYQKGDVTKLRTLSYSLPEAVQDSIVLVDPGLYFGGLQAFAPSQRPSKPALKRTATPDVLATRTTVDASCQTSITPACLKELYSIGNYTPSVRSGSKIGFGSFLNQSAQYNDAFIFEETFGIPPQNFSVELIAGGVDNQDGDIDDITEADLDVENIIGIAHPLPVVEFITGGSPPFVPNIDQPTAADNENEPYVPYYRYLLSQPVKSLPQVISNSYGDEEDVSP